MANGVCDSYCKGCAFNVHANGECGESICTYFIYTSMRRPCPAGTGCTVKETGKKRGAWAYQGEVTMKNRLKLDPKEAARLRNKRKRDRDRLSRLRKAICPVCGKTFITSDSKQKYCNEDCRLEMQRRTHKEKYERRKHEAEGQSAAGGI